MVVVGIAAILIGAGAGYLVGNANERTLTSTATSTYTSYITVTTATSASSTFEGIQLALLVEPTNLGFGQNVTIKARVYNPTPTELTVTSVGIENPSQFPCYGHFDPAIDVYSGGYTFANLSRASPLLQYNAIPQSCQPLSQLTYTFLPDGANSTQQTVVLGGYYVHSPGGFGYSFQHFPRGQYTVLAFDEWGQQAMQYFTVT